MKPRHGDRVLRLIAVFKFFKAALVAVAGFGAFELIRPGVAARVQARITSLAAVIRSETLSRIVASTAGLDPRGLETVGVMAFLYAALYVTEGTGLWLGQRWAEYLTVIASCSLVPFEAYELMRHLTSVRIAALGVNLVVVGYLIYRLRRERASLRPS